MKKLILTFVLATLASPSVFALPGLQLWIDGATYDDVTETYVTDATTFDLYVIGNGTFSDVMLSMALDGIGEFDDPSAVTITIDGVVYPTDNWTYGYAPLSNVASDWDGGDDDLPKHDIYPAWYTEFNSGNYAEIGGVGNVVEDSAIANGEPFWFPTDGYIPGGNHLGEFRKFTITIDGPPDLIGVHFDAYTLLSDGTIDQFAPFSHDAGYVIPEPTTMLLFGIGLTGAGVIRKFRK